MSPWHGFNPWPLRTCNAIYAIYAIHVLQQSMYFYPLKRVQVNRRADKKIIVEEFIEIVHRHNGKVTQAWENTGPMYSVIYHY